MNRRLQQFLSAENISQAQFADSIDVARASVSHVLAGRNKPGYDFIRSISEHYPKLNLEWLISGKGKMYKSDSPAAPVSAPAAPSEPVSSLFNEESFDETYETANSAPASYNTENKPIQQSVIQENASLQQRSITKIIVFYDDNTFQELK